MHPLKITPEVLLDSIYNGIVAIDENGAIIYFNKTAERIFNLPAQEALNRFILDVLPNTGGKLLECLKTGNPFRGEKLKGEALTLIANIHPLWEGRPIGAISVFQDISEIETISKDLDLFKNLKNWLDAIIDSSYDGLWICDNEGKVVRINKSSERISKIKAEAVVGKNVRDLIAEGFFKRSVTLEVFKKGTSVTIIQETRDGKKVLSTGNPIFNENGEIAFVVTNIRDITELDSLRSQLQETQALAREYISKLSELEMKGVDLSNIIFRSEEMERVLEMAIRVADVNSTVLLLGESGVGKGMIAKLIHKNSARNNGPFIRVDCAGIPDTLVESELFGYVIPLHQHHRFQLLYASSGVMTVTTVKGLWVVPPLRAVWVPALAEHQIHASGKLSMRTLYIKPDTITGLPQECCVVSIPPLLRELILYAVTMPPLYQPSSLEARIMTIILELVQTLRGSPLELPIPRDARLQRIFQTLTENPADNCSLEQWGSKVGATSRTLARIFQSDTGMSFRQWRQQIRILEALKRLAGNQLVTSVALDLGYDSPSAFIAMFRKAMGTTPGRYFKGGTIEIGEDGIAVSL